MDMKFKSTLVKARSRKVDSRYLIVDKKILPEYFEKSR